jgi:hypothetical protein
VYYGWLVADDGTLLPLGQVEANYVTPLKDAEGRVLLATYSGAQVSTEVAGAAPTAPSSVVLSGTLPASVLPALRELLASADTPDGLAYDPGAKSQSGVAAEHSQLALDAARGGDLAGAQRHAEHVINIIVGENSGDQFGIAYGDHNGDGTAENPGNGFGVWPYINEAILRLDTIIESPDGWPWTKDHARQARQCLVNAREQSQTALTHAQELLAASTAEGAAAAAEAMWNAANASFVGVDADGNGTVDPIAGECGATQAYQLGHDVAAIVLAPPGE